MARQSEMKLERLLQKAESLFLKYGYKAVSMDQLAQEAGISKMTIYKHYHSKDDLFIAVLINMTDYHVAIIEKMLDEKPHTLDKIEALYSYSMNSASLFPDFVIKEIMERSTIMAAVSSYKQKWTLHMWRKILETGIAKGEIRKLDVDFTATLLMNMPLAFMNTDFFSSPENLNRLLTNFYDFVKYGLLGTTGQTANKLEAEEAPHGKKNTHASGKPD